MVDFCGLIKSPSAIILQKSFKFVMHWTSSGEHSVRRKMKNNNNCSNLEKKAKKTLVWREGERERERPLFFVVVEV